MSREYDDDSGIDAEELDKMFDAFAAIERRRLLTAVYNQEPIPYDYSEMDGPTITHIHIPKLVDYGYLEWDREEKTVTTGPRFGNIEPFLSLVERNEKYLPTGWPN